MEPGARTDEQLADNLSAVELELTDAQVVRIEHASRPPVLYPDWHQHKTAADGFSDADLSLHGPRLGA